MILLYILLYLLSIAYWLYTGEILMGLTVPLSYVVTWLILRATLRPKKDTTMLLFTLFFLIYGTLVLLTQMELILNYADFYVHTDAPGFSHRITKLVLPCSWSEIFSKTIGNSYFNHYPLAAFIMSVVGKVGMTLGIVNLRLFLRIHILCCGASVIAIITHLFETKGISKNKTLEMVICFGLFSFLYISSGIFTRDIYVTLAYTVSAYLCLRDDIKHRLFLFILMFFVSLGLRPENGLLYLIYPAAFYYHQFNRRIGAIGKVVLLIVFLVILYFLQDYILAGRESVKYYDQRAMNNAGGMFAKFYSLPFPFNTIIMIIFMSLQPLPMAIYCIGAGMTWLNLPYVASPYLLFFVFSVCAYYLLFLRDKDRRLSYICLASFLCYFTIIFGSPDVRRAFAAIPGLYMCYGLMQSSVPDHFKLKTKQIAWPIILALNIFFTYYVYFR